MIRNILCQNIATQIQKILFTAAELEFFLNPLVGVDCFRSDSRGFLRIWGCRSYRCTTQFLQKLNALLRVDLSRCSALVVILWQSRLRVTPLRWSSL